MSSTVILKASGLVTSPNQLDVPDGALTEANNIIIKRDGVIEPRRGFKLHGNALPNETDRVKQLMIYRDRIIRHYSDKLQYDSTGNGDFVDFADTFVEAVTGLRFKSVESNGNTYLTSNEGIKKLSSSSSDLSTTTIQSAGGIKAVDLTTEIQYDYKLQTGFLPQDSTVRYRSLWNINDANSNLIQGSPSEDSIVYNPMLTMIIQDYLRVLLALDNVNEGTGDKTKIEDGDYSNTLAPSIKSSASEVRQSLIDLSVKLDEDIEYANTAGDAGIDLSGTCNIEINTNICTISKTSANFNNYLLSGSKIEIKGLTSANQVEVNGTYEVTSATTDDLTFLTEGISDFGPIAIDGTVIILSNEYRGLETPPDVSSPATNNDLVNLQLYLNGIIQRLQQEPPQGSLTGTVINSAKQTDFIQPLDVTTTSNVKLRITIPNGITEDHFLQIYRSSVSQATETTVLDDLTPSKELKLIYEQFVTSQNLLDGYIDVLDETPDSLRGANLYTNPSTGEGNAQANDIPPFAKDINRFRNVLFYANTRTRHRLKMTLLPVNKLIDEATAGNDPTLSIISSDNKQDYKFVLGATEQWDLTCTADSPSNSLNGLYFDVYSAEDRRKYRFYYKTSGGTDTPPPTTAENELLVRIDINTDELANDVAIKTKNTINLYASDFFSEDNILPKIKISNIEEGNTTNPSIGTTPFTFNLIEEGVGEDSNQNQVLISSVVSSAQAIDATARSLVRIINKNSSGDVYAYYTSGATQLPGEILIESRDISSDTFYVIGSSIEVGATFSPDASPQFTITNIDTGTSIITLNSTHGLTDGDEVVISFTKDVEDIDGIYSIEYIDTDKIKIPVDITGFTLNNGTVSSTTYAQSSENEERSNRIYYSKFQQPEAVPIVNYFDVGARDKPILRIFPLRDSLFVFKVDGVYRVSGEVAPFNVQLFDSSTKLIADDTVDVVDNIIYCWTEQGISAISESNAGIISRVIDVDLLKIGSSKFTNFRTATWGKGYESDNSYIIYTTKNPSDTNATIGYRYSTLTNTWTNFDKSPTCGIVNDSDDTMYLGASDTNYIERERKDFERTDYAEREYIDNIGINKYKEGVITLDSLNGYSIGDVITQNQTLTVYQFNMLLRQLDNDLGLDLSLKSGDPDGYISLEASAGDNLRGKIIDLAARLDSDTGLTTSDFSSAIASQNFVATAISVSDPTEITAVGHGLIDGRTVQITVSDSNPSIDGTYEVTVIDNDTFSIPVKVLGAGTTCSVVTDNLNFEDIKTCYNIIVDKINLDVSTQFNNYMTITGYTLQEAIIKSINTITKKVTLNQNLEYVVGEITVYEAIDTSFAYAPNTMGDPLGLKHLREAQLIFENRAITSATMEFATDLLPQFDVIEFDLDGNGIFGHSDFGAGFFGGGSNSAPFRTYVPRKAQYCTYMRVRFTHQIAREKYSIFATTLTGEVGISTRAFR